MGKFLLRRLFQTVIVLFGASLVLFVALFVLSDPFAVQGGKERTPEAKAALEKRYGLDKPVPVQYVKWVSKVARLDFGESFKNRRNVNDMLAEKLPNTAKLAVAAVLIDIGIGVAAGLISAIFRYSFLDVLVTLITTAAVGFPSLVLGLGLQYFVGIKANLLPYTGTSPPGTIDSHIILPALTLALIDAAVVARLMRGTMLEVMRSDYVRTARAKGLTEPVVMMRHAFRNAIIPVVTYLGIQLGALMGGALITENVFNWDGVGRQLVQSIYSEDNPIVLAIVVYGVLVFVVLNFIVDMLYGVLDPRIRLAND